MNVNVVIALMAAALTGAGLVLQQQTAERAPKSSFLHLRLIIELVHKPRWLTGIGIMAAGQALSVWAIGHLELTVAEPLMATSLLFALLLAVPLTGQRLRKTEIFGALLLSGGVAVLSVSRSVNSEGVRFGSAQYWPAAAAIAVIALLCLRAGWRRAGSARAVLTSTASGLVFGISDALTRRTVDIVNGHSFWALFASWPVYSLVAASIAGLWLMESSFNAAPLNYSLPAMTAAEPLAGIALGVIVFGDVIRVSTTMIAVQSAGIAALVIGVILVARAPVLAGLRTAHPALAHPTLPTLPYPTLPHPVLHRPTLPLPALARPGALPRTAVLPALPEAARSALTRLSQPAPQPAPHSPEM
jgi:drug/metabolite transporter (DMT)-like permease